MNKKDKIIKLSDGGMKPKEIAEIVDCPRNYVYYVRSRYWNDSNTVRKEDIDKSKKPTTEADFTDTEETAEEEEDFRSMAEITADNTDFIGHFLKNNNNGGNDNVM